MIQFRVYGLPRSGTAWVANWLTTDRTQCWHDPCEWAGPVQMDAWGKGYQLIGKVPGVSCTGSWRHRYWRPEVPTIKLIRPIEEIQSALSKISLPLLSEDLIREFESLDFDEYHLSELMDPCTADTVWHYLLPNLDHNPGRHRMLTRLNVQLTGSEIQRVRDACALSQR